MLPWGSAGGSDFGLLTPTNPEKSKRLNERRGVNNGEYTENIV
jgi:hypothetical protein